MVSATAGTETSSLHSSEPCDHDCWHTGLSWLKVITVDLYDTLAGSNPHWLKGDELFPNRLYCTLRNLFPRHLAVGKHISGKNGDDRAAKGWEYTQTVRWHIPNYAAHTMFYKYS